MRGVTLGTVVLMVEMEVMMLMVGTMVIIGMVV